MPRYAVIKWKNKKIHETLDDKSLSCEGQMPGYNNTFRIKVANKTGV
jgi:hypothetical protein